MARLTMALTIAVADAGCSGYQQETAPVRGKVTLNGKPLPGGSVMFVPQHGRGAVGQIDGNGSFVLGTYRETDGAIVGRHKVAVFPVRGGFESDERPANYVPIPQRYQSSASSDVDIEIRANEDNVVEIKLTSAS